VNNNGNVNNNNANNVNGLSPDFAKITMCRNDIPIISMQKEDLSLRLCRKIPVLTLSGGRFLHGDKHEDYHFMPVKVMWLNFIIPFNGKPCKTFFKNKELNI
jgi:hypothetical protein